MDHGMEKGEKWDRGKGRKEEVTKVGRVGKVNGAKVRGT